MRPNPLTGTVTSVFKWRSCAAPSNLVSLFPSKENLIVDLFGGSGEVAVAARLAGYSNVLYNEIHPFLYDLLSGIKDGVAKDIYQEAVFIGRKSPTTVLDMYGRAIKNTDNWPRLECAAMMYMLLWSSPGGMLGKGSITKWNIPDKLAKKSGDIQRAASDITLCNEDYGAIFHRYDAPGSFFFIDPPWPGTHFEHNLTDDGFLKLVNQLIEAKGRFLMVLPGVQDNITLVQDFPFLYRRVAKTKTGLSKREMVVSNYPLPAHKEITPIDRAEYSLPTPTVAAKEASDSIIEAETKAGVNLPERRTISGLGERGGSLDPGSKFEITYEPWQADVPFAVRHRERPDSERPSLAPEQSHFQNLLDQAKAEGWFTKEQAFDYYIQQVPEGMGKTPFNWHIRNTTTLKKKEIANIPGRRPSRIELIAKTSVDDFIKERKAKRVIVIAPTSTPTRQSPSIRKRQNLTATLGERLIATQAKAAPQPIQPGGHMDNNLCTLKTAHGYLQQKVRGKGIPKSLFDHYCSYGIIPNTIVRGLRHVRLSDIDVFLKKYPSGNLIIDVSFRSQKELTPGDMDVDEAYAYYRRRDAEPLSQTSFLKFARNEILRTIRSVDKGGQRPRIIGFRKEELDDFLKRRAAILKVKGSTAKPEVETEMNPPPKASPKASPSKAAPSNKVPPVPVASVSGYLVSVNAAYEHYCRQVETPLSKSWMWSALQEGILKGKKMPTSATPHGFEWRVDLSSLDEVIRSGKMPHARKHYDKIDVLFQRCRSSMPPGMKISQFRKLVYDGLIESRRRGRTYYVCRQAVEEYFLAVKRGDRSPAPIGSVDPEPIEEDLFNEFEDTGIEEAFDDLDLEDDLSDDEDFGEEGVSLMFNQAFEYYKGKANDPLSVSQFRKLIAAGDIEGVKIGPGANDPYLVSRISIDHFLRRRSGGRKRSSRQELPVNGQKVVPVAAKPVAIPQAAPTPEGNVITLRMSQVQGDVGQLVKTLTAQGYEVRFES